jgi:hypothetical protein
MLGVIGVIIGVVVIVWCLYSGKRKTEVDRLVNRKTWYANYTSLVENFDKQNIELFYKELCRLEIQYKYPPTARNIYFQAHQFISKYHSGYSLLLYLHYLHVQTPSDTFRHKKIGAELKKILFRNKMQETRFTQICARLKTDRDLAKAIDETKLLFHITRRKIQLDVSTLEEAGKEQSQTAELLGKYLEDESEVAEKETIRLPVVPKENRYEIDLLQWFESSNFTINKKEIDTFARNKGVFSDSLIQQINETYYETLDDLLIENEGEEYILNKVYYQQIKNEPEYKAQGSNGYHSFVD